MKVSIDKAEERILERDINVINNWWNKAASELYSAGRLIYCVEIDEQSIFDNYEQVIVNNYHNITGINIKSLSKKESIEETRISLNEYLNRFIPVTLDIADYFYSEVTEEQWAEFSKFLEGLSWIVQSIQFLNLLTSDHDRYNLNSLKLEGPIEELEQALEAQDYVLVADIIRYDLIPQLEQLLERTNKES